MTASTERPAFGSDMGLVLRAAVLSRRCGDPVKFWTTLTDGAEMMRLLVPVVEHIGVLRALGYKTVREGLLDRDSDTYLLVELFRKLDELGKWPEPVEECLTTGRQCPYLYYESIVSSENLKEIRRRLGVPERDALGVEYHFLRKLTECMKACGIHPEELLGYLVVHQGVVVRPAGDKLQRSVLFEKIHEVCRRRVVIEALYRGRKL